MKMLHLTVVFCGVLLVSFTCGSACADVLNMGGTRDPLTGQWTGKASLEFVTVGDPGNAADVNYYWGAFGAVPYAYQVGKYDVTAGQYCEFLNAVAKADPYGLYTSNMAPANNLGTVFGITRGGSVGGYAYSVSGNANFPMNWVNWANAARFCNWLSNGQPTGAEGPGTTETGSYTLTGTNPYYNADGTIGNYTLLDAALMAVTRNPGATYVIPTEDEWYKAAYYKGGGTNAGYWLYPTQSNAQPSNVLSSTGVNNANYYDHGLSGGADRLTEVGAFAGSPSAYGTFDQAGNVWQLNETNVFGSYRGIRGGCFADSEVGYLSASYRSFGEPSGTGSYYGFRVALVPEPTTLALLALGSLLIARRRRA